MLRARRSLSTLFLVTLAAVGLATPALSQDFGSPGEQKTIAVLAVSGYQGVMDDIGYVGKLMGNPHAAQGIEGMLKLFTQGKGLVGLDKTRPWGAIVQGTGMDVSPIICLPVDDLDALVGLGAGVGVQVDDLGEGVRSLTMQDQTLFIKAAGDWAYAAQSAQLLASVPEDPASLLSELTSQYDIGVRVMAQNVPDMFKQMAVGGLVEGLQQGLEQQPGETDEQFATRSEMAEVQVESIKQLIEDLDQAIIGIAVNPADGGAALDVIVTAVPGTKLADQMAMYEATGTRFAGFLNPSASLSAASAYTIPDAALGAVVADFEKQMNVLRAMITQSIEEDEGLPNEEVKETILSVVDDLFSSMEATVRSGRFDMVGHMQTRVGDFSLLAAFETPEPDKIDSALKKAAALAEDDPSLPSVNWAAETHQDVTIHTATLPVNDRETRDVFGSTLRAAIGIGADAVYFSLGGSGAESLKEAIDASASQGKTPVKPFEMTVALDQMMEFLAEAAESQGEDGAVAQMFAQLLQGEAKNHLRITAEGVPQGVKYQLVVEEAVLKAIATAASQVQGQMQGPPMGPEF